jgi:hypothetical protein
MKLRRAALIISTALAAAVTPWVPRASSAEVLSPTALESRVLQWFSQESSAGITSINAVQCDDEKCSVRFTGIDPNPQRVSSAVPDAVSRQAFADGVFLLTSSFGTEEIAPSAREYAMHFTYALVDEPARTADGAARQHAACASAWLAYSQRAVELELPNRVREGHAQAEVQLAAAAAVLGSAEAEELAKMPDRGPLIRECIAARMFISDRKGDTTWRPRGSR